MNDVSLFVYGTISDPEFFEHLLLRKPVYRKALLKNYEQYINPTSGYLFVKPAQTKNVAGKLVKITKAELQILDLWEEIPFYDRQLLSVECDGQIEQAFVYTQNNVNGIPIDGGKLKDPNTMLDDIKAFRKWIDGQL